MSFMKSNNILVYVDGVLQPVDDLMITATQVFLKNAPPAGTEVLVMSAGGANSYPSNGTRRNFRHQEGVPNTMRIVGLLNRANQHLDHPGINDLFEQLETLLVLLDEENT